MLSMLSFSKIRFQKMQQFSLYFCVIRLGRFPQDIKQIHFFQGLRMKIRVRDLFKPCIICKAIQTYKLAQKTFPILQFIPFLFHYDYRESLIYLKKITRNTECTNEPHISGAFKNIHAFKSAERTRLRWDLLRGIWGRILFKTSI